MFTAAYLANRSPHLALGMTSPHQLLKGTEPDLKHLRVVGARALVHIECILRNLLSKQLKDGSLGRVLTVGAPESRTRPPGVSLSAGTSFSSRLRHTLPRRESHN